MKVKFNIKIIVLLLVTVALTIALISILSNYYIRENFTIFCNHYGSELPQCIKDTAGQTFLKSIQQSFLLTGAIGVLFSLLLGTIITKVLLKPVQEIIKATSEFSSGKYSSRIKIRTNDEFDDLIKIENKLFESIENQEQLRKDLVANFSHEISTPLTNIYGYIQALQEGVIKKKEVLKIIERETKRLIKLSYETKSLALLESDSVQYQFEKTNINKIVSEVINIFKSKLSRKKIRTILTEEYRDIYLEIDKDKIKQALTNILNNAIEYSHNNTVINITLGIDSNFVSITVKDHGIGIAKADLKNIFERFYKVRTSNINKESTGIGLTISKKIIEVHSGEIEISSKLNKGTTVTIRLPIE